MTETQTTMKLETLPNEILGDCFEYFHTLELLSSFGQLNHRFDELIRIRPWHLDFQHVHKSLYDLICQQMLRNPELQKGVYSLRLSNENTPGQIKDFLWKFSLDQFVHLRSLTFIHLHENNILPLQKILPKLSQLTAVYLIDSNDQESRLESVIPLDNLQTLSINSTMTFVQRMIPIKHLILFRLSLNDICRLFQFTPLLEYLKVLHISTDAFTPEYHQSLRPDRLRDLILFDFPSNFEDLTHFLQNMFNLTNLTICTSSNRDMFDAPRWEELVTLFLPSLINLQFKLATAHHFNPHNIARIFDRFQTNFWLNQRRWHTECAVSKQSMMIYTIPYIPEGIQILLASKRYRNPLIDGCRTFDQVKKLNACVGDLFEHGDYYFPNIESLIIARPPRMSTEKDEERVMESLSKMMSFSHLKHLEIPLNCQAQRPAFLFQILELAPQLSSLSIESCFFEVLLTQPESYRYLNGKIKKLDLNQGFQHSCQRRLKIPSLYQLIPDLEQLTMRINKPQDWLFLLNQFSKLSSFRFQMTSTNNPDCFDDFTIHASQRNAIVEEIRTAMNRKCLVDYGVWITRRLVP